MGTIKLNRTEKRTMNRRSTSSTRKTRVCAYCRVSTNNEEQVTSYENQMIHYQNIIKNNPEWEFAGIYADEGISGTGTAKRNEFNRMINEAKKGNIDLILVKNISRFSRNTLDALENVRLLKEINVSVKFEEEGINTLSMNGELLLTVLSSVAQAEVQNLSEHTTFGLRMKTSRGEMCGFNGCLGYDWDKNTKTLSINEEEAKIVRYIFERYCQGIGGTMIVKELKAKGYKNKKGSNISTTGVLTIIKNPIYCGDLLAGKSYTIDPIIKRRLKNYGERDQYYTENHHEAIISREIFQQAQEILAKRNKNKPDGSIKRERYSRKYAFSSKIQCGYCGKFFSRRIQEKNKSDKARTVWECVSYIRKGREGCPHCKAVREDVIESTFIRSFNELLNIDDELINNFVEDVKQALIDNEEEKELKGIDKEVEQIEKHKNSLLDMRLNNKLDDKLFQSKLKELNHRLDELQLRENELQELLSKKDNVEKRLSEFKKLIDEHEPLKIFDREIFELLVDHIVIGSMDIEGNAEPYHMKIIYKTGAETIINEKPFPFENNWYDNADNIGIGNDYLQCVTDERGKS